MAEIQSLLGDCKKAIQQLNLWTSSLTSSPISITANGNGAHQNEIQTLTDDIEKLIKSLREIHQKLTVEQQDEGQAPIEKSEEASKPNLDPSIVQIIADRNEINRRINAFIERKKLDANITNKREFYPFSDNTNPTSEEGKSARTHAVFVKHHQQSSHVKVTRVSYDDTDTPRKEKSIHLSVDQNNQKRNINSEVNNLPRSTVHSNLPVGIEERLVNMENYLGNKADCPMPNDIYARLKYLEDRILFLESVSPEYITPGQNLLNNNVKQLREHDLEMSNISTDLTIDHTTLLNIEEKISALKKELTKS